MEAISSPRTVEVFVRLGCSSSYQWTWCLNQLLHTYDVLWRLLLVQLWRTTLCLWFILLSQQHGQYCQLSARLGAIQHVECQVKTPQVSYRLVFSLLQLLVVIPLYLIQLDVHVILVSGRTFVMWNFTSLGDVSVVAKYSKTSLTQTSGDRPKTSVLTEVRVSENWKKSKPKIALLSCIQLIVCFDRRQVTTTAACFCPLQFHW